MPKVGLEPTRVTPHEFESCASANSATSAICCTVPTVPYSYRNSIPIGCLNVKYGPVFASRIGNMNEQQAIERARQSDVDAFNQLVLAYQNLAYSVAYRMLRDEAAAADAVQDSFIKAYRALSQFKDGNFKSWLMRIVVNTCYDVLRVRGRRPVESLDDMAVEPVSMTPMSAAPESPESYAERSELRQHIESSIEYLPQDQRLAVMLCDVHGYAYEEIVDITGWPMGTVKSRISRGRIKLQEYLLRQPELLPLAFRPKDG